MTDSSVQSRTGPLSTANLTSLVEAELKQAQVILESECIGLVLRDAKLDPEAIRQQVDRTLKSLLGCVPSPPLNPEAVEWFKS